MSLLSGSGSSSQEVSMLSGSGSSSQEVHTFASRQAVTPGPTSLAGPALFSLQSVAKVTGVENSGTEFGGQEDPISVHWSTRISTVHRFTGRHKPTPPPAGLTLPGLLAL